MHEDVPDNILDAFKSKVTDICTSEGTSKPKEECKKLFTKANIEENVKWMDLLMAACLVNGGVLVRDPVVPAAPPVHTQEKEEQEGDTVRRSSVDASLEDMQEMLKHL